MGAHIIFGRRKNLIIVMHNIFGQCHNRTIGSFRAVSLYGHLFWSQYGNKTNIFTSKHSDKKHQKRKERAQKDPTAKCERKWITDQTNKRNQASAARETFKNGIAPPTRKAFGAMYPRKPFEKRRSWGTVSWEGLQHRNTRKFPRLISERRRADSGERGGVGKASNITSTIINVRMCNKDEP